MVKRRLLESLLSALVLTILVLANLAALAASENDIEPRTLVPFIITPCGKGELVYSDDFSDPNSGWMSFTTDEVEADYYEGEYRLFSKIPNGRVGLANGGNGISTSYYLEVDVRNVDGKPGEYGIIFGFEGALELDFYTFMIDPAGNYAIYYNASTHPDPLQTTLLFGDWSATIQPGTAANKLGVAHTSSEIEFYVNDVFLTALPSDRTGSEQSGMMALSGNQANLDIRYDNFKVYKYLCPGSDWGTSQIQQPLQTTSFALRSDDVESPLP